jgi:hypothetical protein
LALRKAGHEVEEQGAFLDRVDTRVGEANVSLQRLRETLPSGGIEPGIRSDSYEPGREGHIAPLESRKALESTTEGFGSHVLGQGAIVGPGERECVDHAEVALVNLPEVAEITLGRLNESTVRGSAVGIQQSSLPFAW